MQSTRYSDSKIYAFIDSNNLYQGVSKDITNRNYCGWKIDLKRFRIYLFDKYKVSKAYLFIGYLSEKEWLYKKLKRFGYILIYKPTVKYKKDKQLVTKGNVDAELVLHSMIQINNYDKCVIVTGDGDYKCLIEYLVLKGKLEAILIPNQLMYSRLLIPFKKHIRFMNQLKEKLQEKNGSVACSI